MAIDVLTEQCVSLSEAAKLLPRVRGRKPPHPMTLYRWAVTGLKANSGQRVQLETTWVGGTRMTSIDALERFFARKNDPSTGLNAEPSALSLKRSASRAVSILKQKGMLHELP